ncbi:MAG: hypothetical protein SOH58_05985 [Olsenella sp.]|jgi:hypothetical protein
MAEQDGTAAGAGEVRTVDLGWTLAELVRRRPEAGELLDELGFGDLDGDRTLAELARDAGVDLSIVGMALGAAGFDVVGYEPTEDAKNDPLEALVQQMSRTEHAAPGSSVDPMVERMEYAIKRAQQDGTLPTEGDGAGA